MRYPDIDPVLLHLGPFQIRWYGIMYIVGFLIGYLICLHLSKRDHYDMSRIDIEDCLFYSIIGIILGGRLGYCLIYNLAYYLQHPLQIFAVWHGGMSFHGAMIGFVLAVWLFARRRNKSFWMIADMGAFGAAPGLFFGRIGNFINGELFGRVTDVPWGMVFPGGGPYPRHPSQLYESFLEGALTFMILGLIIRKDRPYGTIFGAFMVLYGVFRFVVEFFREPDPQLGFVWGTLSMGQILCSMMIVAGVALIQYRRKKSAGR